jgi:hypothetical protein
VVAAAEEAGITSASLMLVLHSVEFDPKRVTVNPNAPIRFIGNFDSHVSEEGSRDRASSFFWVIWGLCGGLDRRVWRAGRAHSVRPESCYPESSAEPPAGMERGGFGEGAR